MQLDYQWIERLNTIIALGDGSTSSDGSTSDGTTTGDEMGSTGDDTGSTGDDTGTTGIPEGCGDGEAQGEEECDGLDLRGAQCDGFASPGNGNYHGGSLACQENCMLDFSGCHYCGDDSKNGPSEECDGADVGNASCEDEGFQGGQITCDDACTLSTDECMNCEGDKAGMYGTNAQAGCGGPTYGLNGKNYNVCQPMCEVDADCADVDLALCPTQPTCVSNACKILCDDNADCPGGMVCIPNYSFCGWEI